MANEYGGPAYPTGEYEKGTERLISGMTLRDWFAGQALMGMLVRCELESPNHPKIADFAYRLADAMLVARKG